ncbi:MAG: helix-turn-helix domain-containing protein [Flagellimonas sp.]
MENLVTAQEAADLLACSRQYIDQLRKSGTIIPVATIHPKWYFDLDEVLKVQKTMKPTYSPNQK